MVKVSVVINTLNEEKNIQKAISSVFNFADEIVVVDMKSTDRTRDIAKKLGARVYETEPTGYVEPARNFGINLCRGEWLLVLDADEEVSLSLRKSLKAIIKNPQADYYRVPRKNIIFGKWIKHSRWWPDYNIRFFKKGMVSWNEIIHSVPMTTGDGADLPDLEENALVHHHYQTIEQYIERLNRYTTHNAQNLVDKGYTFEWPDLVKKPTGEFLSRFFVGEGYRDGLHGAALAGLQAFSEFVVYLKTWQLGGFKSRGYTTSKLVKNLNELIKEYNFWKADVAIKNGGGFIYKIRRKFRI